VPSGVDAALAAGRALVAPVAGREDAAAVLAAAAVVGK